MDYAATAAKVERTILKAGAGAMATLKHRISGDTSSPSPFSEIGSVPVVDISGTRSSRPDGSTPNGKRFLIPGISVKRLGVELATVDRLIVGSEEYAVDARLDIQVLRPNPLGPVILYDVLVTG